MAIPRIEKQSHWVANPSTVPECGCGWLPSEADILAANNEPLTAVEVHVRDMRGECDD